MVSVLNDLDFEDDQTIVGLLRKLIALQGGSGGGPPPPPVVVIPAFSVVSITGASTATPIAPPGTVVRASLVQNISTNAVTLGSNGVRVGMGYILNAASAAGNAGDTVTIVPSPNADVVDISQIFFNQTGTGVTISRMDF